MNHLKGECPVCHKGFTPEDDVVTCPVCGTPYHRACYQQAGHCLFEDKHKDGYEYKPPQPAPPPQGEYPTYQAPAGEGHTSGKVCPKCQTINDSQNIFCEQCGYALGNKAPAGFSSSGWSSQSQGGYTPPFGGGPQAPFFSPAAGSEIGVIDGFTPQEWSAFIGPSSPSYLHKLHLQSMGISRFGFSIVAFFLSTFYFAYRKMWKWAAISFITLLAVNLPSVLLMMQMAKVPFMAGVSAETLKTMVLVCTYLSLARKLYFGIYSLTLFRHHATAKMHQLKLKFPQSYLVQFSQQGGVSTLGVCLFGGLLILSLMLVVAAGGPPLAEYVQNFQFFSDSLDFY